MSLADLSVNFFVALFALIDPIGNVPVFAAATVGATPAGRRRLALYIALFSLAFLTLIYVSGLSLLRFFGISLSAFRIAGGLLLFLLGLDMARNDFTARFTDPAVTANAASLSTGAYAWERFERLVVPFAMPLLIGPGAISTVVIYAGEARPYGLAGFGAGLAVIAVVSGLIVPFFWTTSLISRLLGRIGMTIVVRVLGLILCAMAVQFIIAGIGGSTHGLVRADAISPYQQN
ncbi:MAG TPA: MarC family protein [Caulobacteraceae bacterium]|jgi:multiple antibiotic resistance protein|nr:MarC family protein [Caulobacteraceae bacterium]